MVRNQALTNAGWTVICQTVPRMSEGFKDKISRGFKDESRELLAKLAPYMPIDPTGAQQKVDYDAIARARSEANKCSHDLILYRAKSTGSSRKRAFTTTVRPDSEEYLAVLRLKRYI